MRAGGKTSTQPLTFASFYLSYLDRDCREADDPLACLPRTHRPQVEPGGSGRSKGFFFFNLRTN